MPHPSEAPAGTFALKIGHYHNVSGTRATGNWLDLAPIESVLLGSAVARNAVFKKERIPNWPQSFARRGLEFSKYGLSSTHPVGAVGRLGSIFFIWSEIGTLNSVQFQWCQTDEGVLQGEVVTQERQELKIRAKLCQSLYLHIPLKYADTFARERFSAFRSTFDHLEELAPTEETRTTLAMLSRRWIPGSFAVMRRE